MEGQTFPQVPQLFRSNCRLAQKFPPAPPVHSEEFTGQAQALLAQIWLLLQTTPHPPQLNLSKEVVVQVPLQSDCPTWQEQAPLAQTSLPGQTLPQVPQLKRSVAVTTQRPLQLVWPVWQTHVPEPQT